MADVLDDPTFFLPTQQTTNRDRFGKNGKSASKESEEDDTVFQFANGDMGALNRFLHGGRVLPLTPETYYQTVGILNQDKLTAKIQSQIQLTLETFKAVHRDCAGFLGDVQQDKRHLWAKGGTEDEFDQMCTWDKMGKVSGEIWSYSKDAGGKVADDSYYVLMLTYCRKFNEATTAGEKEEARTTVVELTESLLDSIEPIQAHIEKIKTALNEFDKACEKNEIDLQSLETNMTDLLNEELGSIEDLQKEIDDQLKKIEADQKIIDNCRYNQEMTAAYVWIPLIGTIAAIAVYEQNQEKIDEYESKIKELQKLMKSENEDIQIHKTLQGNLTSMKNQSSDLRKQIGPARTTVEELGGGWEFMRVQLEYIHDKAAKFEDKIPSMTMTEIQLNSICNAWNGLETYVASYIQTANVVPIEPMSLDAYVRELDQAKKKL
ncbi:uncharacterized protein DSM5745_07530 [Aspergillus mulundensis]|uniref:Uncharacterized protein n=1 Tax=Aspergillus mulundensis TaxID=1810919 RepID=A0A3D8REK9_9EURO|nr:hypothetical protein DSM5745_07530 [Aspergillus mulundensis]RDW72358.1 hypothetical protein DSM5745_07530 [Aspergillus mulundensis]